ncbi:MAG: hypothetical protein JWO36_240 [Myxococcales bacterium]|nr:hypothetical protein [Myxococcales bacterium]
MTKLWLAGFCLVTACGKPKHLAECDTFEHTLDQIAACKSLPPAADHATIDKARKQLHGMFEMLDQAGGIEKAPPEMQDSLKETCRAQNTAITQAYQKLAPDCLK